MPAFSFDQMTRDVMQWDIKDVVGMLMRLRRGLACRVRGPRWIASCGLSSIAALKGSSRPVKPVERQRNPHWKRLLEL
jgi:hypothetical protein